MGTAVVPGNAQGMAEYCNNCDISCYHSNPAGNMEARVVMVMDAEVNSDGKIGTMVVKIKQSTVKDYPWYPQMHLNAAIGTGFRAQILITDEAMDEIVVQLYPVQ